MLVKLLRMGIWTSNVQKKINKCKDEFYLHLVMRQCKVWNHDETEILKSNPVSALSNIIFWFTQCNQCAEAPTSAKASIDQGGGLQNGSVRLSEDYDFLFIQKLSPFQSQGHLTGWVVEDELLEEADREGLQQLTWPRYLKLLQRAVCCEYCSQCLIS